MRIHYDHHFAVPVRPQNGVIVHGVLTAAGSHKLLTVALPSTLALKKGWGELSSHGAPREGHHHRATGTIVSQYEKRLACT